jgi:2-polyprenyl-3-methyl-5-hydroxy-6-metoxy-1,4-benzoquinol methylase
MINLKLHLFSFLLKLDFVNRNLRKLARRDDRLALIVGSLQSLPAGQSILDAGCGEQPFKKYCTHLKYKGQDFGEYIKDEKVRISPGIIDFTYGHLDYAGNVWDIKEVDDYFDAVLCTQVFEHIPYPNETIREFARLLKKVELLLLMLQERV